MSKGGGLSKGEEWRKGKDEGKGKVEGKRTHRFSLLINSLIIF